MIGGGCRSRYVCCLDSGKIIDGEMLSWQPASLDRLRTASEGVISEKTTQCQAASRVHQLRNSRISVLSPLPFCLWARLTAEKEHSLCLPWETPTCSGQGSDSEIWREKKREYGSCPTSDVAGCSWGAIENRLSAIEDKFRVP